MASKPEITSLNDFVKFHQESFTSYELWLTDELTDYLVAKRDLEKPYTSIVVDIDEDNPIYGVKDNSVQFRFNGRFYIPREDKDSKVLDMETEQWVELFKKWFEEQKLEVVIDETATDFIKFTAIISVLQLPEESAAKVGEVPEGDELPEEKSEDEEVPEEVPEESSKEEEEPAEEAAPDEAEEDAKTETPAEPEDDKELKDFEDALGL